MMPLRGLAARRGGQNRERAYTEGRIPDAEAVPASLGRSACDCTGC